MSRVSSLAAPLVAASLAITFQLVVVNDASAQTPRENQAPRANQTPRKNPFDGVKYWAYQLKSLNAKTQARIARSPFDLVVIDYAKGSTPPLKPLTRREVSAMKIKPDGSRRVIIAYLSIGEAEKYRYYWPRRWNRRRSRPAWIGKESKEWKGNFLVKYWNKDWQNIIFGSPSSYVDRILKAGFDGFYIDRADAYYRFGDTKLARQRMADFVIRLSRYIHAKQPNAAIMLQNAEELLTDKTFVGAIDAIAKEDLMYGISHVEQLNKRDDIDWSTDLLEGARKQGKRIFVVEYLKKRKNIAKARSNAQSHDYVFYYGPRGLFEIRESVVPGWKANAKASRSTSRRRPDGKASSRAAPASSRVTIASAGSGLATSNANANANAQACKKLITHALINAAIKFRTASAQLQRASFRTLDKVAVAAQKCNRTTVEIDGYTDSDGDAKRNKRLSLRRAQSVRRQLIRRGTPASRLVARGLGQSNPIAPNDTPANKARNRRIDFKILPQ